MAKPRKNSSLAQRKQFIHAIRKYYRDPGKDPYDQDHLWDCFQLYWGFLYYYADPKLTEVTPIQWQAYEMSIKEPESADWRTRRGGKSLSFAVIGPFFSIIQFGEYEGFGIYRAPYADQLKQFTRWLKKNPFVLKISLHSRNEADILLSEKMDINKLSDATSASLGASYALLDEEKKIDIDSALESYAMETRGIMIEGQMSHKRIIHKSTGGALTYWEKITNKLQAKQDRTGIQCIIRIPWQMCHWITAESIEEEALGFLDSPWYVPQEYECINIPKTGHFFKQERLHIVDDDYFENMGLKPRSGGLDWNGDLIGHILEIGVHIEDRLYLMDELRFDSVPEVADWITNHPWVKVEVEGKPKKDGYNAGFSDHLMTLNVECSYQGWDGNLKDTRLALLQRAEVYVSKKCTWFIRNYQEATFDNKQSTPKLLKTPTQHGLDGVLHLLATSGGLDTFSAREEINVERFEELIEYMKYAR